MTVRADNHLFGLGGGEDGKAEMFMKGIPELWALVQLTAPAGGVMKSRVQDAGKKSLKTRRMAGGEEFTVKGKGSSRCDLKSRMKMLKQSSGWYQMKDEGFYHLGQGGCTDFD